MTHARSAFGRAALTFRTVSMNASTRPESTGFVVMPPCLNEVPTINASAIFSTAVSYLETAVAKEPTPRRQFHLAMSYLKTGKRDQGEKILQLALQQDPKLTQTEKGW